MQRRVINALVRKSKMIQFEEMREVRKTQLILVVVKKDMLIMVVTKSMILNRE